MCTLQKDFEIGKRLKVKSETGAKPVFTGCKTVKLSLPVREFLQQVGYFEVLQSNEDKRSTLFHMPSSECTITLQYVTMQLGWVDKEPITGITNGN
ncbi:hypothetical protein CR513_15669, partial [Mucuna pruriens]